MPDVARFTELLFADQTLDDLLTSRGSAALSEGTWERLSEAADYIRQNEVRRAERLLLELSASPNIETRVLLWSWTSLRKFGIRPEPGEANDIKGVVIQVPMGEGVDVLAAYVDGTARYINYSGKLVAWDIPDAKMEGAIHKLLECCKELQAIARAARNGRTVVECVRVTLLTLDGNQYVEASVQALEANPMNQVLAAGADLMDNLIKRSKSLDRIISQTSRPSIRRQF